MQVLQVQAARLVDFDGGECLLQHAHQFVRPHLRCGAHVYVQLAAAADAVRAVAPLDVAEVQGGLGHGEAVIRVIDVMTFDDAGKFTSMRAYWGQSDMVVLGPKKG